MNYYCLTEGRVVSDGYFPLANSAWAQRESVVLFQSMKRKIINFDRDEEGDWRAELDCGHYQHVRHKPPLISRRWVLTAEGRREKIGVELECKKCDPEFFSLGNLD